VIFCSHNSAKLNAYVVCAVKGVRKHNELVWLNSELELSFVLAQVYRFTDTLQEARVFADAGQRVWVSDVAFNTPLAKTSPLDTLIPSVALGLSTVYGSASQVVNPVYFRRPLLPHLAQ